jgi:hypothetical protein
MKLPLLLAMLVVAAPSAFAADKPLRLTGGPKAEDALRKFVSSDPRVRAKIDDLIKREEAFLAENRDTDLRDAVTDTNASDEMRRQLAKAAGSDRARVLQRLPGMKSPVGASCAILADCATPELALDVASAEQLPDALRSLVRPWMLLQSARGSVAEIAPLSDGGDAVLSVRLKGLDAAPLTLNVSPRILGGFKVWFDQPLTLASLYGRERDAALKSSRR